MTSPIKNSVVEPLDSFLVLSVKISKSCVNAEIKWLKADHTSLIYLLDNFVTKQV